MKLLEIKYKRFWINRIKRIEVPASWQEMNCDQFRASVDLFTNSLPDDVFISRFFGIKLRFVKRLSAFEKYKLIELAEFLTGPKVATNFFYVKQIPGTDLLCPYPRLKGVSFEHFALFDTFFFDYVNDSSPQNLCRFVAALYVAKKEKITGIDFEKRVRYILKHVDYSILYAIFLNYTFIRRWLSGSFRYVFGYDNPDNDTPSKKKQPEKHRPDWSGILDSVVGDDILDYDKYRSTPCIIIFKSINSRIEAYKKNGKSHK